MTSELAQIVAQAQIQRLSLVGLAKNVGKTTATNHLLSTLLSEHHYQTHELALTSLGLDGEATDVLTGLPKPRYVPQAGLLVATAEELLVQAEQEGTCFERLQQLPGRTTLGPVFLARILQPGNVIIAGPTLLRNVRLTLNQFQHYGARLSIIDGAINRLGAAAPSVTDACIVCTGASVASTPELVARRTADVLTRLMVPQTTWQDAYRKYAPPHRLSMTLPSGEENIAAYGENAEPTSEATWIVEQMRRYAAAVYLLRGALTEELARALLERLSQGTIGYAAELVVEDGTKIFCHAAVLHRLAARGLSIKVAQAIRILAITINPYTPEYVCSSQRLYDALERELPDDRPPIIDVLM